MMGIRGGKRLAVALASLACGGDLNAQSVHGRVVLTDTTTPAVGAIVIALDATGREVVRAMAGERGQFALQLPRAGSYRFKAIRIGWRPSVTAAFDIPGDFQLPAFVLQQVPFDLPQLSARERRACDPGRVGPPEMLLQLLEQARAALAANELTEQGGFLDLRAVTVDGHMDAVNYFRAKGGHAVGQPFLELDTLAAAEVISVRPFATTPAETLLARGFVRPRGGATVYDAPSASFVVSDSFVARHCLGIAEPPRDHPDWIGIGFVPRGRPISEGYVGVRGFLWLDARASELRRIDFDYVNVRDTTYLLCDPRPDSPRGMVPRRNQLCDAFAGEMGLGGYVDYARLATGEWFVTRWMIRTPPDRAKSRYSGIKERFVGRTAERCYSGPDCHEVWGTWPRLVIRTGAIESVMRGGGVTLVDTTAAHLIRAATAKQPAWRSGLEGSIVDDAGQPLANAIVAIEDPGRVAVSDDSGQVRLVGLPSGERNASFRCRGHQSARVSISLKENTVLTVRIVLPRDSGATTNCSLPSP